MEPICQLRSPCPEKIVSNFTFHTLWESKGDPRISANVQGSSWLPPDLNSPFSWVTSVYRLSCHSGPAVCPRGSKWENQLLPPSPQSLYYSKIFMLTEIPFKMGHEAWKGGRCFYHSNTGQNGVSPDLKSLRALPHWGHFSPLYFILYVCRLLSTALSFPLTFKIASEIPHTSYFLCNSPLSRLKINSLSLPAKEKCLQARNPPSQRRRLDFTNCFSPHYSC